MIVLKSFYSVSQHLLTYVSILSVLKTFLHDPLVEWSKQSKGLSKAQANETGEIVNEKVCAFHVFLWLKKKTKKQSKMVSLRCCPIIFIHLPG